MREQVGEQILFEKDMFGLEIYSTIVRAGCLALHHSFVREGFSRKRLRCADAQGGRMRRSWRPGLKSIQGDGKQLARVHELLMHHPKRSR